MKTKPTNLNMTANEIDDNNSSSNAATVVAMENLLAFYIDAIVKLFGARVNIRSNDIEIGILTSR